MKTNFFFRACYFSFLTVIYAADPTKSDCLEREKALALLETAENLLSKATDSYPSCEEDLNFSNQSECSGKKALAYIEISKQMILDVRNKFPTCPKTITVEEPKDGPKDCSEVLASGKNASGIYTVWPRESGTTGKPLRVYCDMNTDLGGWTVIQRRGNFSVQQDFFLDWESYKNGFGNLSQEFWLGNENIRVLCRGGCKIRFDLEDKAGLKAFAIYQSFNLSDESGNYTIKISNYSGNAGDSMKFQNNYGFSTKDRGFMKKAQEYRGGWWYDDSMINNNLNGLYLPDAKQSSKSIVWYQWRDFHSLARVEMKVKPL